MTVRFAAARRGANSVLARHVRPLDPPLAANSDGGSGIEPLRAALEHFGAFGLSAATRAAAAADGAHARGDLPERDRWEAILTVLDRRLADRTRGRRRS
jgi:hypothetical protein